MTGAELGRLAYMSQPKISKIETGRWPSLSERDFGALMTVLVPSGEDAHELRVQFRLTQVSPLSYRCIHHHGVDMKQLEIQTRERSARVVHVFEPVLVPGLLQTPDYASALFAELGVPENSIERAVAARSSRQSLLSEEGRLFHFVVGEAALYTCPGEDAVQIAQLTRLITDSRRVNVRLGVVPLRSGMPARAANAFTMMDLSYVTAETVIAEQQVTDPADINSYASLFEALVRHAEQADAARELIRNALSRFS